MNFIPLQLLTIVAIFHLAASTRPYCYPELCKSSGQNHVACENPAPLYADFKAVPIPENIKKYIVERHNIERNKTAGGDGQLPRASCMLTMEWSDELATLASYKVEQSIMGHTCHNTPNFPKAGQSLEMAGFYNDLNLTKSVDQSFNDWDSEKKFCKKENIKSFTNPPEGGIGHFTAIVIDKNKYIGCAISTFNKQANGMRWYLFACNYAWNNINNAPIYVEGAFNCTTGRNPKYSNLCSSKEVYPIKK